MNRRLGLRLGGAAAVLLAATAAMGWLHTPAARPWLKRLGLPCPAGSATEAQVTEIRELGLAQTRGTTAAPARPALGMLLDRWTESDANAWAVKQGAACELIVRGYRFLRCRNLAAAAVGEEGAPVSELWLSFGPKGTLVAVDVYRRGLDGPTAAAAFHHAADRLRAQLGVPTVAFGDASPEVMTASALQTARVQYRYTDYLATVTAANLQYAGLAVREQYVSAGPSL